MKILKRIAIVLVALIALYFIAGLIAGSDYEVTRSATINVPANTVFNYVADHNSRTKWDPWAEMDAELQPTVTGTMGTAGAKYHWKGNPEITGEGEITTMEVEVNKKIVSELRFIAPWETTSTVIWDFEAAESGTKATWTLQGAMPLMMWPLQFTMDGQLGPQFEKGLSNVKKNLES